MARKTLLFGNMSQGESFEIIDGVEAIFLEYTKYSDIIVCVNGYILKLHKYDHGQRRKWYFSINDERYYAQGHYKFADDIRLDYSIHKSHTKYLQPKKYTFKRGNINFYYYDNNSYYKKHVDNLMCV